MAFELISGIKVHRSEPEPHTHLVDRVLCTGANVLAGDAKVGKTTLAMQLSLAVATGEPAFGNFEVSRRGKVLYCSLEETMDDLRDRQHRIDEREESWTDVDYQLGLGGVQPGVPFLKELRRCLEGGEYALAVVDLFIIARQPERPDSYALDYRAISGFTVLGSDFGIPVLLLHHTNKKRENGDGQDRMSGTTGLAAAATVNLVLTQKADRVGKLTISGRRMPKGEHQFRMNDAGIWLFESSSTEVGSRGVKAPTARERILAVIPSDRDFRAEDVQLALPEMPSGTIRRELGSLDERGILNKSVRGVYRRADSLTPSSDMGSEQENDEGDLQEAA